MSRIHTTIQALRGQMLSSQEVGELLMTIQQQTPHPLDQILKEEVQIKLPSHLAKKLLYVVQYSAAEIDIKRTDKLMLIDAITGALR